MRRLPLLFLLVAPAGAQERLPIIDMHLHASAADNQGPPPLAMCTPFDFFAAWDPAQPFGAGFMARLKQPTCKDPVWSPKTDQELMTQTIEVMNRRNIVGVLSGRPDRVVAWVKAAPRRFLPGCQLDFEGETVSPESLRALHAEGRLAVLAEIANQYAGIAPDDPRMEPYWALAEELDIPAGIHIGTGPRDILYHNAARFLRLGADEIARHHKK